jgi:hypothetical protein
MAGSSSTMRMRLMKLVLVHRLRFRLEVFQQPKLGKGVFTKREQVAPVRTSVVNWPALHT